jgi:hypothetical protein
MSTLYSSLYLTYESIAEGRLVVMRGVGKWIKWKVLIFQSPVP